MYFLFHLFHWKSRQRDFSPTVLRIFSFVRPALYAYTGTCVRQYRWNKWNKNSRSKFPTLSTTLPNYFTRIKLSQTEPQYTQSKRRITKQQCSIGTGTCSKILEQKNSPSL